MNLSGFSAIYPVLHPSCLNSLLISMQWKISIWKHPIQFPQILRYQILLIFRYIPNSAFVFFNEKLYRMYHLQGKKWDFSFTSIWNTVVWLMLMNFFIKIVNSTAQTHLKKQQESKLAALTKKSDSDTQWNALIIIFAVHPASSKLKFKFQLFLKPPMEVTP